MTRDYPCQNRHELFEPYVAPGESMALRGLRLVNATAMCSDCPIKKECERRGKMGDLPRGVWGGKVLTRLDKKKTRRSK